MIGLVGQETEDLQHFAEFGVVMMLFLIGLELEPRALWDMRHRLLGLGGLQIAVTTLAVMVGAMMLDQVWSVALAIGMIFALSSTAIVLQTLSEKGLMQTGGGRSAFSVLLTQDIAVLPMLALLPLLAQPKPPERVLGEVSAKPEAVTMARRARTSGPFLRPEPAGMGRHACDARSGRRDHPDRHLPDAAGFPLHPRRPPARDVYRLALLIVVGIAFLMNLVGLSPALGAFMAGVVLASSEFRHELESDIEPFKGLLLGLFFITVGAGIDFSVLFREPVFILGLALAIILLKGAILYLLGRAFDLRGRNLWLFTLSLSQAGEFGFVLISFSGQQNVLPRAN